MVDKTKKNDELEEVIRRLREMLEQEKRLIIRIALFGQPGSGKSSLINRLIGKEVAPTGVETDTTKEAQIVEWQKDLFLVDLPGYDTSRFPAGSFCKQFNPKDYDLFLCVFDGKLHKADVDMFKKLKQSGKVTLFVRNKIDALWQPGLSIDELKKKIEEDVAEKVGEAVKVYFVSCRTTEGFGELIEAVKAHLDVAKRDKWIRRARAYSKTMLQEKRQACEKLVTIYAGLAAANALNPIPGLDIAVDLGILHELAAEIAATYGLSTDQIESAKYKIGLPLANKLLKYLTREAIVGLLKKAAERIAAEEASKYIPIVGQIIASGLAFSITKTFGNSMIDDFHEAAERVLESEIQSMVSPPRS